ncbi:MAG: ABC transporter permease [Candidatus Helarchaeota archaeon]
MSMVAIIERDLRNFFKYKYWIIVLLITNLADLLIMAASFSNLVTEETFNYFLFFAPGITVLSLFGASFIMGIEVSQERHSQRIHYLLSLPIDRFQFIVARAFAGAIRSLIFCIPLLIIAILMLGIPPVWLLLLIIGVLFILAMGLTSLGIILATAIQNTRRYQLARGFVSMWLMFGSTVFYPRDVMANIPGMNIIADINPLSFGANILRGLLDPAYFDAIRIIDIVGLLIFSGSMIYFGLYFYNRYTKST